MPDLTAQFSLPLLSSTRVPERQPFSTVINGAFITDQMDLDIFARLWNDKYGPDNILELFEVEYTPHDEIED